MPLHVINYNYLIICCTIKCLIKLFTNIVNQLAKVNIMSFPSHSTDFLNSVGLSAITPLRQPGRFIVCSHGCLTGEANSVVEVTQTNDNDILPRERSNLKKETP